MRPQMIKYLFPVALGKIFFLHPCYPITFCIIINAISMWYALKGCRELFQVIATYKFINLKPQHVGDTHNGYP